MVLKVQQGMCALLHDLFKSGIRYMLIFNIINNYIFTVSFLTKTVHEISYKCFVNTLKLCYFIDNLVLAVFICYKK